MLWITRLTKSAESPIPEPEPQAHRVIVCRNAGWHARAAENCLRLSRIPPERDKTVSHRELRTITWLRLPGRLAAAGAAASLLFLGMAPGVAASGPAVTFSSQSGVATLVSSYAVSPGGRASSAGRPSAAAADLNDRLPDLAPKAFGESAAASRAAAAVAAKPAVGSARGDEGSHLAASFIGQQASNVTCSYFAHGCNPPDMAIAASPRWVLQGVNTQWEVLDTKGQVQAGWPTSAQAFFHVPSNTCDPASGGQPFLSDPRALYDPSTGRFWAAMLQVEGGIGIATACPAQTIYYIAVSQTRDPSGSWNVYAFDMSMGTTNFADFTQIGLDGSAVYFSANMFNQAGTAYEYAEIFEANKHQMETGGTAFRADGFFNLQAHGPGGDFLADTVQPALNLDGGGTGVFVDTFDGPDPISGNLCSSPSDACRGLAVWRLHNPTGHDHGGAAPTLTGARVDTQPFVFPPPADEPGCRQCVDASDLRIGATPVERDGVLSAAWETGTGSSGLVPGIEWAQISVGDGRHSDGASSGYYASPRGAAVTYPAVMPARDGELVMVFDRMSAKINPETRFIVRNQHSGKFSGNGRLLKAGEAPYRPGLCGSASLPVCRWGDYSAASWNGRDAIWIAGQYANSFTDPTAPPVFGRNWGTWIGELGGDR